MSSIAWRSAHRSQTGQFPGHPPSGATPYVVVVFGRTGVGVSSLVNLVVGHPVSDDHPNAKTLRAARGRKPKARAHAPATLPGSGSDKQFCLYEVPGFCGRSRFSDGAILEAIRRIDEKEGIDLFVYCLRKQRATVMPKVVRHIWEGIGGSDARRDGVPMIAVVTELERFEAEGGMEEWWDTPLADGSTNGTSIERMCFGSQGAFDAHACVTTLPRKDVDLVEKLRKRREISEERVRRLILEQCSGRKRPGESR